MAKYILERAASILKNTGLWYVKEHVKIVNEEELQYYEEQLHDFCCQLGFDPGITIREISEDEEKVLSPLLICKEREKEEGQKPQLGSWDELIRNGFEFDEEKVQTETGEDLYIRCELNRPITIVIRDARHPEIVVAKK